jgi:molybdate/tungstate transport system substrate-binding protein
MRRISLLIISGLLLFGAWGCKRQAHDGQVLHIIHAGSLTYPVQKLTEAFARKHPDIRFRTEAWGSKAGARRVMEIESPADVFLSADYMVIEHMLIPEHASWYVAFAANEMAIVYTHRSRYAGEISQDNWHEIMLRPDVSIGRSDPDHDPCGVRSVFTAKLAELYYQDQGLASRLLEKDRRNIRPKETDLIALLESGHLDYIFLYRSVAQQHNLPYLRLPAQLHQGDPSLNHWYGQVQTNTLGARPGETITETGQAMVYGVTIPHKTNNPELAEKFVEFLVSSEGIAIMESLGQPGVVPSPNPYFEKLPEGLQPFAHKMP